MVIVSMSLAASVTILAAIILRSIFVHQLPKRTFILLWCIVIFRLLIPVTIPSRFSFWNLIDGFTGELQKKAIAQIPLAAIPQINFESSISKKVSSDYFQGIEPKVAAEPESALEVSEVYVQNITSHDAESSAPASPGGMSLLFWLWFAGTITCAMVFMLPHLRWSKVYKTALPVENGFIRQWQASHPLPSVPWPSVPWKRSLIIKQSDRLDSPLTYGIFKPVILLPRNLDWQDKTCLSYILSHEYVHIRHFDTLLKWILAFALAIHWFNPLVWVMYILANRDIELYCDETVLRRYGIEGGENIKSCYASTLISLEEKRKTFISLCSSFSKNVVEERIISIMKIRKASFISILAAIAVLGGTTLVFATGKADTDLNAKEPELAAETAVAASAAGTAADFAQADTVSDSTSYIERMLFITEGDTQLKATYDGNTWEAFSANTAKEAWRWYSYEEFAEKIELIGKNNSGMEKVCTTVYEDLYRSSMLGLERDAATLKQTLADIKNGIKVSRSKSIFTNDSNGPDGNITGFIHWYCFGYTFQDRDGQEVDLGLFETRDALFAALWEYYENEVSSGRLTKAEAGSQYGKIAHEARHTDEKPLAQKLHNREQYRLGNPITI